MAGIDFSYPKTYILTSCTSQYVKNDNFSIFGDPYVVSYNMTNDVQGISYDISHPLNKYR